MKKIMKIFVLFLALFVLISCGEKTASKDSAASSEASTAAKKRDILNVTVSIPPQAFIVKTVGKDKVRVNTMMEPSSTPETYEPGPKKMADLKDSALYLKIGVPFEAASIEKLAADYKNIRFADMAKGINFRKMEGHFHPHHHCDKGCAEACADCKCGCKEGRKCGCKHGEKLEKEECGEDACALPGFDAPKEEKHEHKGMHEGCPHHKEHHGDKGCGEGCCGGKCEGCADCKCGCKEGKGCDCKDGKGCADCKCGCKEGKECACHGDKGCGEGCCGGKCEGCADCKCGCKEGKGCDCKDGKGCADCKCGCKEGKECACHGDKGCGEGCCGGKCEGCADCKCGCKEGKGCDCKDGKGCADCKCGCKEGKECGCHHGDKGCCGGEKGCEGCEKCDCGCKDGKRCDCKEGKGCADCKCGCKEEGKECKCHEGKGCPKCGGKECPCKGDKECCKKHGGCDCLNGKGCCGHHHGMHDPHVWLDPMNLIVMTDNTVAELSAVDPENAAFYRENGETLKAEIKKVNDEVAAQLKEVEGKSFVVHHPAFGYFAERFGLKQVPLEIEGKEPGAVDMAKVVDFIKQNNAKAVFMQAQLPDTVVKSVAEETKTRVVTLDPLAENVLENIKKTANEIKGALIDEK